MADSNRKSRGLPACAGLAALLSIAAVSGASAQFFPPMGAVSPGEVAQRLQAEGFVLIGPLRRNDTIYLADVNAGPEGRERLVIDAWSGEILQRFVPRQRSWRPGAGGPYVVERGEFDSPPPLGPPPMRDFTMGPGGGNFAYGGPPDARVPSDIGPVYPPEPGPRTRTKSKPAARHKPIEASRPAITAAPPAQPAKPQESGSNGTAKDNSGGAAPPASAAAPAATTSSGPEASQQPGSAPAAATPTGSLPPAASAPKPDAPASSPNMVQTQAKDEPKAAPSAVLPANPPVPAAKPAGKPKVNDVPVNTLD